MHIFYHIINVFSIFFSYFDVILFTFSAGIEYTSPAIINSIILSCIIPIIILLTIILASIAWASYTFYYWYIDPSSFWFSMLILVLTIVFLSYKNDEFWVLLFSVLIMFFYEWLRFVKFVPPWKIWYIREILFSFVIVIVAFIIFKKINFWREQ